MYIYIYIYIYIYVYIYIDISICMYICVCVCNARSPRVSLGLSTSFLGVPGGLLLYSFFNRSAAYDFHIFTVTISI